MRPSLEERNEGLVLQSGESQCPETGWGYYWNWNTEKGYLWAEACDSGHWDPDDWEDKDLYEETITWCDMYGFFTDVTSAIQANKLIIGLDDDFWHNGFDESEERNEVP